MRNYKIDSVAIVSGGIDSVTMLHYMFKELGKNPAVLTFKYNQKHIKEVKFAELHTKLLNCPKHLVIDLSNIALTMASSALIFIGEKNNSIVTKNNDAQPDTYVPNRNMIFLSIAAAFAESNSICEVFYGAQQQDIYEYWDTSLNFLNKMNRVLSINPNKKIKILAPFIDISKAEVLKIGNKLNVDYKNTWTCYSGQEEACGVCLACKERMAAFKQIKSHDPIDYSNNQNR